MNTYEKGLVAGDTAFKIGGKKLYIKTENGLIMKLGLTMSQYNVTVPSEELPYATGYMHGYDSAKEQYSKRI